MEPAKSKREIVYEYLLRELISNHYEAGERMNISQIAADCHVSEIPVREALRQLEGDGYVRFTPNQGAFAIGITRASVSQIVQVKGVLEGFASRLSLDYLTRDDIAELKRLEREMADAMERKDRERYSLLNKQFHSLIYHKCNNNELIKVLDNLWKRWVVTGKVFGTVTRMSESCAEHRRIIELIERKEYEALEGYVREHKFKSVAYWMLNPGG